MFHFHFHVFCFDFVPLSQKFQRKVKCSDVIVFVGSFVLLLGMFLFVICMWMVLKYQALVDLNVRRTVWRVGLKGKESCYFLIFLHVKGYNLKVSPKKMKRDILILRKIRRLQRFF